MSKKKCEPNNGWYDWEAPSGLRRVRRETPQTLLASLVGHKELMSGPSAPHKFKSSLKEGKGESWDLGRGFDGAVEDASQGSAEQSVRVAEIANLLMARIAGQLGGVTKKLKHSDQGSIVDVSRALSGDPEYMIRRKRVKSSVGKMIRIGANCSVAWHVGAESTAKHGAMMVAAANVLERRGFDVGLYSVCAVERRGGYPDSYFVTECKRPGTFVNPALVAGIMGTPAFFRRIVFAAWEQDAEGFEESYGYGYGSVRNAKAEDMKALGIDYLIPGIGAGGGDQPAGGWRDASPEDIANYFADKVWPEMKKALGV